MFKYVAITIVLLLLAFRFAPDATQKVLDSVRGYSQSADANKIADAANRMLTGAVVPK